MTKGEELLALAARVEGLDGPGESAENTIALTLGWRPVENLTFAGGLVGRWYSPDGEMTGHDGHPRWLRSIEASARTIAIALTAAALRALASQEQPNG